MGHVSLRANYQKGGLNVLLLIVLALLAIILFGVGFTIHWLFILAIIAALLFVISFFMGGAGGRSRRAWWLSGRGLRPRGIGPTPGPA